MAESDDEFEYSEIVSFFKRNINQLNEDSIVIRKKAIVNIYDKVCTDKSKIDSSVAQHLMIQYYRNILRGFSDKLEIVRECSIKVLKELVIQCDSLTQFLPYILPVIIDRLNCSDLEGCLHLPEVMRPPPSQTPQQLVKLVENSEEARIQIAHFMIAIIEVSDMQSVYNHVDDFVNILRALAMDPFNEVQKLGCSAFSIFCHKNHDMLLNFAVPMARSVLRPLVSKNSQVRIAALNGLTSILYTGLWKKNAEIMEILIGFRDPNSVLIKEFYECVSKLNYFALLTNDPKVTVRAQFMRCLGDWTTKLPDKFDHFTRLTPYILSGLFDPYPELQELAFDIIEECGLQHEIEKESEYRENIQYGIDAAWTMEGKLAKLPLPKPFRSRPRLGSRIFIRSQVRKYFKALYNELQDVNIESRIKASQLLLVSIVYCEDYMTQFLHVFIPSTIKHTIPQSKLKEDVQIAQRICKIYGLIGRFCEYTSFLEIIQSGLKGELNRNQDIFRCYIKALDYLMRGSFEATIEQLGSKFNMLLSVLDMLSDKMFQDSMDGSNCDDVQNLISTIIENVIDHCSSNEKEIVLNKYGVVLLKMTLVIGYLVIIEKPLMIKKVIDLDQAKLLYQQSLQYKPFKLLEELEYQVEDSYVLELENNLVGYEYIINNVFYIITIQNMQMQKFLNKFFLSYTQVEWKQILMFLLIKTNNDHTTRIYELIQKLLWNKNLMEITVFLQKFNNLLMLKNIEENNKIFQVQSLQLNANICRWIRLQDKNTKIDSFFLDNLRNFLNQTEKIVFEDEKCITNFADVVYCLILLFKFHYKDLLKDIVWTLNIVMKQLLKIQIGEEQKCQLFFSEYKKEFENNKKTFVLTPLVDFAMNQVSVQQASQAIMNSCFELLNQSLDMFPNMIKQTLFKRESIYPQYEELLQSFIKYIIDESDHEVKQLFKQTFKKMYKKTSQDFVNLLENCARQKLLKRVEILRDAMEN